MYPCTTNAHYQSCKWRLSSSLGVLLMAQILFTSCQLEELRKSWLRKKIEPYWTWIHSWLSRLCQCIIGSVSAIISAYNSFLHETINREISLHHLIKFDDQVASRDHKKWRIPEEMLLHSFKGTRMTAVHITHPWATNSEKVYNL